MKAKIVLILVISSLIIGCIDSPKSISSNNEISETITSISDKLLGSSCSSPNGYDAPQMTTEQCDYWVENSINDKYVRWSGTVSNVKDGIVYVSVNYKMPNGLNRDRSTIVALYDISKTEVLNINNKDNIQFSGKINIEKGIYNSYSTSWEIMINGGMPLGKGLELYNSKIIKQDNTESSIKSNVQSGISPFNADELPKSKTFDVSYVKINDSYIQINVKNIGTESLSNFNFNIGSQRSPVLGNLNPGDYLSATFNIKEILGKDNNIDIWINYVWLDRPRNEVLRIAITT